MMDAGKSLEDETQKDMKDIIFQRQGDFLKQERRVCSCGAFIKTHYVAFILNFEEAHRGCIDKE